MWRLISPARDCSNCFGSGRDRHAPERGCPYCRGQGTVLEWWRDLLSCAVWVALLGIAAVVGWALLARLMDGPPRGG